MCLAVPVKVIEIVNHNMARVMVDDVTLDVGTMLVDNVKPNDWVLVHAGYIIEVLSEEAANEKHELFKEFYEKTGRDYEN